MTRTPHGTLLCRLGFFILPALLAGNVHAQSPADNVHDLEIRQGEREAVFKAGKIRKRGEGKDRGADIGFSYGLTDAWATQLSAEFRRKPGEGTGLDAIEWENRFRLTPQGQLPLDLGWVTEIDWQKDRSEGYQVRFGPLLQKDAGQVRLNLNLLFQKHFTERPSRPTEFGYQWQAKYRWQPQLEFGLQGFGELGEWDDWAPRSEQSHRFGPAIFGKLPGGGGQEIKYNAAYLIDPSSSARSHGLRMQLEYGF